MQNMILKTFLTLLLLSFLFLSKAQEKHPDSTIHHEHHKNEIGIGNSPVWFVVENELAYGFHIHYLRNLGKKIGIGLGYERVFDEHKHNTLGLVFSYRFIEKLSVNISPGLTFEGKETDHTGFAMHLETSYDFEIKDLHLGPILELAADREDLHLSLGLHLGFGF